MRAISLAFVRASSARARVPFYFLTSKCRSASNFISTFTLAATANRTCMQCEERKRMLGLKKLALPKITRPMPWYARAPANCMLRRANKSHGYTHPRRYVHTSSKSALEEAFGFFVLLRLSLLLLFFLFSKCRQRERRGERSVKIT